MLIQEKPFNFFKIDDFTGVLGIKLTDFPDDVLGMDHLIIGRNPRMTGGHFQNGGRVAEDHQEFNGRTGKFIIVKPLLHK